MMTYQISDIMSRFPPPILHLPIKQLIAAIQALPLGSRMCAENRGLVRTVLPGEELPERSQAHLSRCPVRPYRSAC